MSTAATASKSLLEIAQQYATGGLTVDVRVEGLEPGLLMHSADAMRKQELAAQEYRQSGKRSKFIPDPADEAEWGAYRMDSGVLYIPSRCILRSLVEAAKEFKVAKSRASLKKAAAAGITVPTTIGLGFPLLDPKSDELLTEYEQDTQRVVIARASVWRTRPLLRSWAMEAQFVLDPEAVPPEAFAQIIGHAGARVGLCDFRPERGGSYGRFAVSNLEVS